MRDHVCKCSKSISEGDFTILSLGGNVHDLNIKERIMIKQLRPKLNKDQQSAELKKSFVLIDMT